MRLKQYFQLLMVALFVFTFQKITIHSKQHFAEVAAECYLCYASEHMDLHHQERPLFVVNEHFAIKVSKVEEKQIVQAAYELAQEPLLRMADFDGLDAVRIDKPSLGYFSTAPPYIFS